MIIFELSKRITASEIMYLPKIGVWGIVFVFVVTFSCKKSGKLTAVCDGSNPKYNSDIKAIVDNNCTRSTCHAAGSPYGNFTNYIGLAPYLSNGLFKRDVIDKQIMPKNKNLSQDDLNKIQCWIESNYPEN